jgi:hypothetical protein
LAPSARIPIRLRVSSNRVLFFLFKQCFDQFLPFGYSDLRRQCHPITVVKRINSLQQVISNFASRLDR